MLTRGFSGNGCYEHGEFRQNSNTDGKGEAYLFVLYFILVTPLRFQRVLCLKLMGPQV